MQYIKTFRDGKRVAYTIYISPEADRKTKSIAKSDAISKSEVLRRIIERALK